MYNNKIMGSYASINPLSSSSSSSLSSTTSSLFSINTIYHTYSFRTKTFEVLGENISIEYEPYYHNIICILISNINISGIIFYKEFKKNMDSKIMEYPSVLIDFLDVKLKIFERSEKIDLLLNKS